MSSQSFIGLFPSPLLLRFFFFPGHIKYFFVIALLVVIIPPLVVTVVIVFTFFLIITFYLFVNDVLLFGVFIQNLRQLLRPVSLEEPLFPVFLFLLNQIGNQRV